MILLPYDDDTTIETAAEVYQVSGVCLVCGRTHAAENRPSFVKHRLLAWQSCAFLAQLGGWSEREKTVGRSLPPIPWEHAKMFSYAKYGANKDGTCAPPLVRGGLAETSAETMHALSYGRGPYQLRLTPLGFLVASCVIPLPQSSVLYSTKNAPFGERALVSPAGLRVRRGAETLKEYLAKFHIDYDALWNGEGVPTDKMYRTGGTKR